MNGKKEAVNVEKIGVAQQALQQMSTWVNGIKEVAEVLEVYKQALLERDALNAEVLDLKQKAHDTREEYTIFEANANAQKQELEKSLEDMRTEHSTEMSKLIETRNTQQQLNEKDMEDHQEKIVALEGEYQEKKKALEEETAAMQVELDKIQAQHTGLKMSLAQMLSGLTGEMPPS